MVKCVSTLNKDFWLKQLFNAVCRFVLLTGKKRLSEMHFWSWFTLMQYLFGLEPLLCIRLHEPYPVFSVALIWHCHCHSFKPFLLEVLHSRRSYKKTAHGSVWGVAGWLLSTFDLNKHHNNRWLKSTITVIFKCPEIIQWPSLFTDFHQQMLEEVAEIWAWPPPSLSVVFKRCFVTAKHHHQELIKRSCLVKHFLSWNEA